MNKDPSHSRVGIHEHHWMKNGIIACPYDKRNTVTSVYKMLTTGPTKVIPPTNWVYLRIQPTRGFGIQGQHIGTIMSHVFLTWTDSLLDGVSISCSWSFSQGNQKYRNYHRLMANLRLKGHDKMLLNHSWMLDLLLSIIHWIGLRDKLQENPIFHGKIYMLSCRFSLKSTHWIIPIGSMYGIFTYIWVIYRANVSKYSIHGSSGIYEPLQKKSWTKAEMWVAGPVTSPVGLLKGPDPLGVSWPREHPTSSTSRKTI